MIYFTNKDIYFGRNNYMSLVSYSYDGYLKSGNKKKNIVSFFHNCCCKKMTKVYYGYNQRRYKL